VNEKKVTDANLVLTIADFPAVIKKGKKVYHKVNLTNSSVVKA
jgi:hypothetical protein